MNLKLTLDMKDTLDQKVLQLTNKVLIFRLICIDNNTVLISKLKMI